MRKSILIKGGIFPIAASFMLMPSFLFAQTEKQIKEIKKKTNLSTLDFLQKSLSKSTLNTDQLKVKAKEKGILYSGKSERGFFQLTGFDTKGKPLYYTTFNEGASAGTRTNRINSTGGIFNLDGQGMTVHEWDGGKTLINHVEFGGRAIQKDASTTLSDHATHVAGTMIASGVNGRAKGMAPKANLHAYDWSNNYNEMIAASTNDAALLSNHSYGYIGGFTWHQLSGAQGWHWMGDDEDIEFKLYGKYTTQDRIRDIIAINAPFHLQVWAAGNPRGDGPDAGQKHYVSKYNPDTQKEEWFESTKERQKNGGEFGFDCINHGALGKNSLTVGAAKKIINGYQNPADVEMASFSGFGPVDDGRIKPDITGIGVNVVSTVHSRNDAYGTMSGTSMASPNVTGSLLLLQELYKNLNSDAFMKSSTLKALAIHTADEAGEHPGPDYKSGWGLLNSYRAALAISTKDTYSIIKEDKIANNETKTIDLKASGTEPLRITLTWIDPVQVQLSDTNVLNDRNTKALVNDLDIKVLHNGKEYLPWKLDPVQPNNPATTGNNSVDNVENIVIENTTQGDTYQLVISHKGNLQKNKITSENGQLKVELENATEQEYSLVVTGINNGVQRDLALESIKAKVSPSAYTDNTPVSFEINNKGLEKAENVTIAYKLVNQDNNQVIAQEEVSVGSIDGNTKITKDINMNLSSAFTNYIVEAEVKSQGDQLELNNKFSANFFGTLKDMTQPKSKHEFSFEDDFQKNGWISEDTNSDKKTWMAYEAPSLAKTGNFFAVSFPNTINGTNDWLFSNPLKLKANTIYRVSFYARRVQAGIKETFSLYLGSAAQSTAMNVKTIAENQEVQTEYTLYSYEFTVPTDQTLHVGIQHITQNDTDENKKSYALLVDDFKIDYAEGTPHIAFDSDKKEVTTFEPVTFVNQTQTASTQPVESYEWIFEPSSVEYQNGTTKNSDAPVVIFKNEGTYKVTLKAKNVVGEDALSKENYIKAQNTPTKADFKANLSSIFQGESVVFSNNSTGNPEPTQWKWTITPSEEVEFVTPTQDTSKDVVVRFNKPGKYSVSLMAKSLNNEHTETKQDVVEVKPIHNVVNELKHQVNDAQTEVKFTWARPELRPIYEENFNTLRRVPAEMKIINANRDNQGWGWNATVGAGKTGATFSKSWTLGKAFTADDYLLTPKLKKGAEVLKFDVQHQYPERYDVYLIPAPDSGTFPTVDEIKAGHKIYTFEGTEKSVNFFKREIDITDFASGKDFYIAFHHRTLQADNGFHLALDNIFVGYKNANVSGKMVEGNQKNTAVEDKNYKDIFNEGKVLVASNDETKNESVMTSDHIIEAGLINSPELTGYEIVKNDVPLTQLDKTTLTYTEAIDPTKRYYYDFYAVYSDGQKSEKKTVIIHPLSTTEVANKPFSIYPNPSNGIFVVEANSNVSSLNTEIYDMSGKLVFKRDFKGNKAQIDLSHYPKGTYILKTIDNHSQRQSVKLMIQ